MAVGVLHFSPTLEPFPLLADPAAYVPDTVDVLASPAGSAAAAAEPAAPGGGGGGGGGGGERADGGDAPLSSTPDAAPPAAAAAVVVVEPRAELVYWVDVLDAQVGQTVAKAVASDGGGPDAERRGGALGAALRAHFARLRRDPAAYGAMALSGVFELREECVREFGFGDVYRLDKAAECAAALGALGAHLAELDGAAAAAADPAAQPAAALEALVGGALAANIFDWGAAACVDLYAAARQEAAAGDPAAAGAGVVSMFRAARARVAAGRPWRMDTFDALAAHWTAAAACGRPP
jgi:type II pantothenate kinase